MNDLSISRSPLDPTLRQSLIQYVYGIIGCMQYVHRQLEPGMPEYIYQEALSSKLTKEQYQTFGYLRGSSFPIAILVNFGTWPKAQIERYYYHDGIKSL